MRMWPTDPDRTETMHVMGHTVSLSPASNPFGYDVPDNITGLARMNGFTDERPSWAKDKR